MREAELVDVAQRPSTPPVTPWQALARPVSDRDTLTGHCLGTTQPVEGSPFYRLTELRNSLARLAALPTAEFDRLVTETLDICSHRLDGWVTALATSRLRQQAAAIKERAATPPRVGGYGWVENLCPGTADDPTGRPTTGPPGPRAERKLAHLVRRRHGGRRARMRGTLRIATDFTLGRGLLRQDQPVADAAR